MVRPSPQPRSMIRRAGGSAERTAATAASTRRSLSRTGFSSRDSPLVAPARFGFRLVGVGDAFHVGKPRQGGVGEGATVAQVPSRDQVLFRMCGQPALAAPNQFVDFVLADRVVLGIVENRNKYVQVGQQVAHGLRARERDRVDIARAPFGKVVVERRAFGRDFVAQRRKDASDQLRTRRHRQARAALRSAAASRPRGRAAPWTARPAPSRRLPTAQRTETTTARRAGPRRTAPACCPARARAPARPDRPPLEGRPCSGRRSPPGSRREPSRS